jgi:hypothetical protein
LIEHIKTMMRLSVRKQKQFQQQQQNVKKNFEFLQVSIILIEGKGIFKILLWYWARSDI